MLQRSIGVGLGNAVQDVNWVALSIFVALFGFAA